MSTGIKQWMAMCFAMLLAGNVSAASQGAGVEVTIGLSKTIPANGVSRIAIGDGALVEARVLADVGQILLLGKQPGETDMHIWEGGQRHRYMRVTVVSPQLEEGIKEARRQLGNLENITIRRNGGKLILSGQALTGADHNTIRSVASRYPFIVDTTEAPTVELKATILLDVSVLEVTRSRMREIGLEWSQAINGPAAGAVEDFTSNNLFRITPDGNSTFDSLPLQAGVGNNFFGISTQITSIINLLMTDGDARLLARPTLTCVSGGTASFLVGGEVPIPVTNTDGAINVIFKPFGIVLDMSPTADPDGFIDTKLTVEVSAIDPQQSFQDLPGFSSRRTDTRMNVRAGETMVVAGLTNSQLSKNIDRLPILGQIPILGELFTSRAFRENESELLVLVTPKLISPASKANQDKLKRADELKAMKADVAIPAIWD